MAFSGFCGGLVGLNCNNYFIVAYFFSHSRFSNLWTENMFVGHLCQVVEAIDLARATMSKVRQNLTWAVAYNVVAIPMAAGVLLPHFDFAMTPSLSGAFMCDTYSMLVFGND